MSKQSIALAFRQYIWLADIIYSAGHITREDINRKWRGNSLVNPDETLEIPERTFHNWKHAIEDLFELSIECDRRTGKYYIENVDQMDKNDVRTWLVNTFAIKDMMADAQQIKSQILFEDAPSGMRFLTTIIEAMRDHLRLEITYQPFYKSHPSTFIVDPYCVKMYEQRWYVLAASDWFKTPRTYALDRLLDIKVTDEKFKLPKYFDAETYFRSVVGVSGMEEKPEKVRIKVYDYQVQYTRTLPIHASQKEVETADGYSIFEYNLVPNYEFRLELRQHMSAIEVLEPEYLRIEMREEAKKLMRMYE